MRLEDATASERRSLTGYIEHSEDVLGTPPIPFVTRLEDDTSDVCKVATSRYPSSHRKINKLISILRFFCFFLQKSENLTQEATTI